MDCTASTQLISSTQHVSECVSYSLVCLSFSRLYQDYVSVFLSVFSYGHINQPRCLLLCVLVTERESTSVPPIMIVLD